ncbi:MULTISPECIES: GNAT family N-acetyltransferase [unclassified Streptomyces]|uniref:GNAT family N-acetyltransferase n=1 Tax=unclassified Streptomyces TaxID=2593676 RepID=UPI002DDBD8ED|nr:GNAT family N-acetyltransferase [Streptomyces sp. NBC_01750]WSB00809.1 GNAT family N-acetyltransferase [Streptomyces sp. NBC_01794]WSD34836.1 GNAT family N-acetyltransferase [Streptomyces sp. NBC_01750]
MDLDVQNYVRTLTLRSPDHVRVGPFTVRYNPDWAIPPANYAIPDHGAEPTTEEVNALIAVFRERDRQPRLEFLPSCAPEVEPALLAAGFRVEHRAPLLACTPGTLIAPPPVDRISLCQPSDEAGYTAAAGVQHLAYGETGGPTEGEIAWLRGAAEGGGVAGLATDDKDGTPVATGGCSVPVDGLSELCGLAVASSHRRRGIGAALSAYLTATAFDRGCSVVWLEPGDADIERIYAGIGYRRVGNKTDMSLQ